MSQTGSDKKIQRILVIYKMLMDGNIVNKGEMAKRFGINERSIQRDIEDIRAYFSEKRDVIGGNFLIVYDYKRKGFRLDGDSKKMSGGESLAVCKILLESRAFIREELEPILQKLVYNCASPSEQKQAEALIANERYHYIEPRHHKELLKQLWELGEAVRTKQYVELWYKKLKEDEPVARRVKPVGIMFSEYYFYLIAFIEQENMKESVPLSPAIYRVDRIQAIRTQEKHFFIPYKDRFEEGEFRKRVQFMFGGRLQRIVFEYTDLSVEAVLDRLPTAEILKEWEEKAKKIYTIQAEVFGNGIDMWLKSQGENVRVIYRKLVD